MTALESVPVTTAPTKERVAYLDNARYWVMLLVVIGHSLTQFGDIDSARAVYVWIYAFHMPFFILISGYTARRFMGDARQVRRTVSTLVVPYLIVETSMQLITRHYTGDPDPLMILSPQWLAWFLAALFVWRLTTPIWRALKYPITTSIIISLTVGLFEIPNVLALPKILGFLPFYVVGMHMSREWFERLTEIPVRIVSGIVLVVAFLICFRYSAGWETDWLLWKQRYDELPLSATPLEGITQRAELLVVGFVMTFAALSLVPK
ncbi:MAG: acyltransferase family protein, partial [Actinomycetes bacterium]